MMIYSSLNYFRYFCIYWLIDFIDVYFSFKKFYRMDGLYDVRFFMSRMPLERMHQAVNSVVKGGVDVRRVFPQANKNVVDVKPIKLWVHMHIYRVKKIKNLLCVHLYWLLYACRPKYVYTTSALKYTTEQFLKKVYPFTAVVVAKLVTEGKQTYIFPVVGYPREDTIGKI